MLNVIRHERLNNVVTGKPYWPTECINIFFLSFFAIYYSFVVIVNAKYLVSFFIFKIELYKF